MSNTFEHDTVAGPVLDDAGHDPYDALADLFLDDESDAEPEAHAPIPFPSSPDAAPDALERVIEGLIVGHLPVLASAWVSQYARHRARELGAPVALLRLRGEKATVELFGVRDAPSARNLEDAVRIADEVSAAWVMRVDEPDEPRLADADIDDLTLLTGADQAAIVASYRVIKRLAGEVDTDDGPAHVRLAAMGSDERSAAIIGEKVRRAATTFLGCEVEVANVVSRIEPGRALTIFEGRNDLPVDRVVDAIRAVKPFERVAETARQTPPTATATSTPDVPVETPRASAAPTSSEFAPHVEGLTLLPTRCPYAEGVELAMDGAGRLHLLCAAEASSVAGLLAAKQWAAVHAPLLSAAHGQLDARDAVLHLMTSDVARVRRVLDTPIRVHLLAPVEVEGRQGWFCTPLN